MNEYFHTIYYFVCFDDLLIILQGFHESKQTLFPSLQYLIVSSQKNLLSLLFFLQVS